jgi:hypothetical protein
MPYLSRHSLWATADAPCHFWHAMCLEFHVVVCKLTKTLCLPREIASALFHWGVLCVSVVNFVFSSVFVCACPVESRLWRVRKAKFHRVNLRLHLLQPNDSEA